ERLLAPLLHSPGLARPDHIVVRRRLLQHPPHRIDVVTGVSPVPTRLHVSEPHFLDLSELYPGDGVRHLSRDELEAAPRGLVIEEDSTHRVEAERLAVVHGDPVRIHLRDSVGRARIEGRRLLLRRLDYLAELFAGTGLVESRLGRGDRKS